MLEAEILRRLRRQPQQRLADVVAAEPGLQRVALIDGPRRGMPFRIQVFGIDRAGAEIRRVAEVGVGRAQIERNGLVGVQCATARRVELVDVVVARLQAVLIRGPDGRHQSVERAARMSAVAPRQLISVLLVEALRLLPRVPAALAFVNKGGAPGRDRASSTPSWCRAASAVACSSWSASTASWPPKRQQERKGAQLESIIAEVGCKPDAPSRLTDASPAASCLAGGSHDPTHSTVSRSRR